MVSAAAGLARHGLLPVVNSFASFLASRANEQIYNQASERTKVVYALHYAGLIPAGPGKSHQSIRDVSLLAALPSMTVVQPANADETRALTAWAVEEAEGSVAIRLAIGPSPRRLELGGEVAVGRGTILREGTDALLFAYGPVMLHEALTAAEALGRVAPGRGACPGSTASTTTGWRRRVAPFADVFVARGPRAGRRARRHAAARARRGGPARGSRAARLRRGGLARVRHAARGAARAPPRRRLARGADRGRPAGSRDAVKRIWLVLPDPLPTRVFFDCGIVDRLRARLPDRLALVFVGEDPAPWLARAGDLPVLEQEALLPPRVGFGERVRRRVDRFLDDHAGFYPLALRVSLRHGFHRQRMRRGHDNWFLDPDRAGRLPRWDRLERLMFRWHFGRRRYVPSRARCAGCGRTARGSSSRTSRRAARSRSSTAARRLGIPVVGYVSSWDHTVGKGAISPYAQRYVVQNETMRRRPRPPTTASPATASR